ncbi:MAG: ankyrin repeat domain-containing protein, partial [Rhodanobacteraceae bacterium]
MPKPVADRLSKLSAALRYMLPAWGAIALAAAIGRPSTLILLIAANALAMTAVCHALGFDMEVNFLRSVMRRGLAYFVFMTAYSTIVAALLAAPVWWLAHGGSLLSALVMSTAVLMALLVLWRLWPAFALPFLWDDAYPQHGKGSWLLSVLRRSLTFAQHLTSDQRLLFSHGLPAAAALLLLAVGALALAGLGGMVPSEFRVSGLVIYGVFALPLGNLVLANRCVRALLSAKRHAQEDRKRHPATPPNADPSVNPLLPADMSPGELDAALLAAARAGRVEQGLVALQQGADPNTLPSADDQDQRSVLIVVVTLADLRLLRALIAKGADVNRRHGGITALIAATRDSYRGRPEAVMTLLANGADPRLADADDSTPLHHAARCAEPEVAALLVDSGAQIDAVNREGVTPLGVACMGRHWPVATFLLTRGASPSPADAVPALHLAAAVDEDDPAGIALLTGHKTGIDALGAFDRTALHVAAHCGHVRIVEFLLAAGANADRADRNGTTALMEAARAGAHGVVHALGKRKVSTNSKDAEGRTALMVACRSRRATEETLRALLAISADPACEDADGKRALDHAIETGRWQMVALLDPTCPLPSNIADTQRDRVLVDGRHLLDALRFGHWDLVEQIGPAIRDWPSAELAELYLELIDPTLAEARCWLLNRGLGPDAVVTDGRRLADVLIAALPDSCVALEDLLARGVQFGRGDVARVLAAAAHDGDSTESLRALAWKMIECGADWCGSPFDATTALHLSNAMGDVAITGMLLERGADPNARDAQGCTPLLLALRTRPAEAPAQVRLLLLHGADPEIADACGETALGLALASGDHTLSHWLDWTGWRLPGRPLRPSDLPAAAAVGDIAAVDHLLALGFMPDCEDTQGATALIRAAGAGHAELVAHLIDRGADAAHAAHSGVACLCAAVSARRESVLRVLLDRGVNPDQRLPGGSTPLMIAAALGQPAQVALLLAAGADVDAVDERGTTALHAAARFAFASADTAAASALVSALLSAGARPERCNDEGQDALLLLLGAHCDPGVDCNAGHLAVLTALLLERNVALDGQDRRGVGVLHACALHDLLGCARLLKTHGARLDLGDGRGRTAGEVAAMLGYVDLAAE